MNLRSPTPWLIGGVLTLAGVGIVSLMRQGAACVVSVKPGDRVLAFGDSLMVGLSTPLKSIATSGGCDFTSMAEISTTMAQWLSSPRRDNLQALMASFRPTVVIVSLGTNDSKGNTPVATLEQQVGQIRDWIVSIGATPVWAMSPKLPFPDRVSPIVTASGIQAFPSSNLPLPQADGIHPTGRGYAGWAEHLWAFMTCSTASADALAGLGAVLRPMLPSFMAPARPTRQGGGQAGQRGQSKAKRRGKRRRRV